MSMPEHIVRMESERSELRDRIAKLEHFMTSEMIGQINRMQVHLLNMQLDVMNQYDRLLSIRIEHDAAIAEAEAEHEALATATLDGNGNADSEQS